MFDYKECPKCGRAFNRNTATERNHHWLRRKFCSRSCAASANNVKYPKRKFVQNKTCAVCGVHIELPKIKNGHSRATHCFECRKFKIEKTAFLHKTKSELFKSRKNWQSARSTIRKRAQTTIERSGIEKICFVCGYSKHVHVCHKKDVSSFDGKATIKEISGISNLVYLCPNHHWEFDNDVLTL